MKKFAIILICTYLMSQTQVFSQNPDSLTSQNRLFQATFISPMGTNGMESGKISNNVSLNIFAGYNGGVKGIEIGFFANTIRKDMIGCQIAGFSNIVLGKMIGYQISGFSNITKQTVKGSQITGFSNIAGDSVISMQIAGFSNIVKAATYGSQIAGFSNFTGQDLYGFQISGFSNVAHRHTKGFQISGFSNISQGNVNGGQISGFVNIARKINGVQIGFINYSDTVEKGIPIGFLSIVKKGYHAFEIGTDETMHLNGSFKTGVNQFYNIFTIGTKINGNQFLWGWGYGIGSMVQLNERFGVNIDLVSYNFRVDEWKYETFNLVNKAKLNLSFRLSDNISVYGGVSYNVFVSNQKTDEGNFTDSGLVPWANYSEIKHNTLVKMYAGANAGLSISF